MITLAASFAELTNALAALPRPSPLSTRAVLVPLALGHALRRSLIESGRGKLLAGTRFLPPVALAAELLESRGVAFRAGEDALRPARLQRLFRQDLGLRRFDTPLLRDNPGWEDAWARTIGDLEAARLSPEVLEARAQAAGADAEQLCDIARVWRALEEDAGPSWSRARVLTEATTLLTNGPGRSGEPLLGVLTGHETAALAGFLWALPLADLRLLEQRPVTPAFLGRVESLYGPAARDLLLAANARPAPRQATSELEVLRGGLFVSPELLAAPGRARSLGPDGSVQVAEHAGVEEEVQAVADWVAAQVLRGVPLHQIAVLSPSADPWVGLVTERLGRLPWAGGALPVFVAGGLPVTASGTGARLLRLVRALRAFLPLEQLPALLKSLRLADDEVRLSHEAVIEVAGSLGIVGGSRARPEGAREWVSRARARHQRLKAAAASEPETKAEKTHWDHGLEEKRLAALLPALAALDEVVALVVARASLRDLGPMLGAFCKQWLLEPREGAAPSALLEAALAPLAADPSCGALSGDDALRAIEEEVLALRAPVGRYGEPAVYLGPVHAAAGLPFRVVRVIGVLEGALPSSPREDPVLPDALRRLLGAPGLRTTSESALAQLHALRRCVVEARDQFVLSAPRVGPDTGQRQPSSVFLDVLAALGRPGAEKADLHALRQFGFRVARKAEEAELEERPVSEAAHLRRVARKGGELPPRWHGSAARSLEQVRALQAADALESPLAPEVPLRPLPGVGKERTISASSLGRLLACPRRFFWEKALHWGEPQALPSTGQLDPMPYGTLFHSFAEEFANAHGAAVGAQEGTLARWQKKGRELAGRLFDEASEQLPLAGASIREQQREKLQRDAATFVEREWNGRLTPVRVEQAFGYDEPVKLKLQSGALHVAGYIDRIDTDGERTLVRDLKTGRPHLRRGDEEGPTLERDLQLGIYGMVVKQLAGALGTPKKVGGAYVFLDPGEKAERAFIDDFPLLEQATKAWADVGLQLLQERAFPRTPTGEACGFCAFKPVCGAEGPRRSKESLAQQETGALAAYAGLCGVLETAGEEE